MDCTSCAVKQTMSSSPQPTQLSCFPLRLLPAVSLFYPPDLTLPTSFFATPRSFAPWVPWSFHLLVIHPEQVAFHLHLLPEPLHPHYHPLLFASLPGRMTSGKPSLRVSARALLNTAWFSRLICSSSPRSNCREMMRPRGRWWWWEEMCVCVCVCKWGRGQMRRCGVVGGKWNWRERQRRDKNGGREGEGRDRGVFKRH